MEPRVSFITLGVSDFERSVRFYRDGLGYPLSSASKGDVAFFKTGGVVLALYPSEKLAEDAKVPAEGTGFRGVTLAHNVRSREEVSEVLGLAEAAGGKITKPAQDTGQSHYPAPMKGPEAPPEGSRSSPLAVAFSRYHP